MFRPGPAELVRLSPFDLKLTVVIVRNARSRPEFNVKTQGEFCCWQFSFAPAVETVDAENLKPESHCRTASVRNDSVSSDLSVQR